MSQPVLFVLVRGGQRRLYLDHNGIDYVFRDVVWGADAFESWVTTAEEIDQWTDEASGGAVVDFDARMLVWSGTRSAINVPAVADVYQRLLDHAWPKFQVEYGPHGMASLAIAADQPGVDDDQLQPEDRCQTIADAAGSNDALEDLKKDDQEEDEELRLDEDPYDIFDDDDLRAWVTLIDENGTVRHYHLHHIPLDLIGAHPDLVQTLKGLPAADLPSEGQVIEGMWIDVPRREVGVWGGPDFQLHFADIERAWKGWTVRHSSFAEDALGYGDQCAISGPVGVTLSDAEALGMIAPQILSTKRFDLVDVFGEAGTKFKSFAKQATGCLVTVLAMPVVLFGLVSGDWRSAGITLAILVAIVVVVFKFVELKVRQNFRRSIIGSLNAAGETNPHPSAAGPMDEQERRRQLNALLVGAGLPSIAEIEPHFKRAPTVAALIP